MTKTAPAKAMTPRRPSARRNEVACSVGPSGVKGRYEVAMEPAREAPAGADGASHKDQHEEGNEPRGGLGPGDDERQAEAAGDDQLMEAALAPIGQR